MVRRIIAIVVLVAIVGKTSLSFAEDVYVTKNGKKYHAEICRLIEKKNPAAMDKEQALGKGLELCKLCLKNASKKIEQQVKKVKK